MELTLIKKENKTEYGVSLKRIPAATFMLGRLEGDGEYASLNDPIKTTLPEDFYISETPVTNAQYASFLKESGQEVPTYLIEHWDYEWKLKYRFDKYFYENPNAPVVGVNYQDALEYIEWLSSKSDLDFRLPTEAEFEWASKGGCTCVHFCERAVKLRNSLRAYGDPPREKVPTVKLHCPNAFGLYDMQGLVWQWCSDWYWEWDYAKGENINPEGPSIKPAYAPWKGKKGSPGRVIRGGSFNYSVLHARCSTRHYSKEEDRNFNLGFRVAADIVID